MISFTLLRTTIKKNWGLLLIFFSVLTMYTTIMASMFDPIDMAATMDMLKLLPDQLVTALAFSSTVADLTGYLASWLYGLLMLAFPMIYCIILGNKLVAKMVDNGSMAYLLSTPTSRIKIVATQGLYALTSIGVLFAALFGVGVLTCSFMFPNTLDVFAFFKLNITAMLVNMTVMMISFFFSCLFNETRLSLAFGAGVPIMFLLSKMLGETSPSIEVLKNFSIFGLFDPVELVQGASMLWVNLIYLSIILVLFFGSVFIFKKKRLPL